MSENEYPVEENVEDVAEYRDVHCVLGVSYTLSESPYHIKDYKRGQGIYHYPIVFLCITQDGRVLPHVVHKRYNSHHNGHYGNAHQCVQQQAVGKVFGYFFVLATPKALAYERYDTLCKAGAENKPY